MSASFEMDYTRSLQRKILWDETRTKAASLLALGHNKQYVANEVGVTRMTIYNWTQDPEFAAEIDRLSTMMDVASRAERLRHAMRVLRSMENEDGVLSTDKDALDWLKYAQSETDGARIDLSKLAEYLSGEQAQQGDGPSGPSTQMLSVRAIEAEVSNDGPSSEVATATDEPELNPS